MAELKACPFCGGEAELKVKKHCPTGYDYIPRCKDPSCPGRITKMWHTKQTAIYAWNRRADNG